VAREQSLELELDASDGDAEELERLTRQLRGQLEELDVDAVEPISGGLAPEGTKAVDWVVIGGLVVRYGPAGVSAVIRSVQAWVSRDARRSVTIREGDRELVLDAATADQQERLVEAFLAGADG
jgi:uncharacterized protein YidB (DUF937 family)